MLERGLQEILGGAAKVIAIDERDEEVEKIAAGFGINEQFMKNYHEASIVSLAHEASNFLFHELMNEVLGGIETKYKRIVATIRSSPEGIREFHAVSFYAALQNIANQAKELLDEVRAAESAKASNNKEKDAK